MDDSSTSRIVDALVQAIVQHRLQPGEKLVEQKLAVEFGVSRTVVRQALFRLSQSRLVHREPARGAFVAAPSPDEARQVFEVRRMLEAGLVRQLVHQLNPEQFAELRLHVAEESKAVAQRHKSRRTHLLGDFHVRLAACSGNQVLRDLLADLVSRCALITLLYQGDEAAAHSHEEHLQLLDAMEARDTARALRLMERHLRHVEQSLTLNPTTEFIS